MPESAKVLTVSEAARKSIRKTVADMKAAQENPNFGGSKSVYLANLEGYLGHYAPGLLDALEALEASTVPREVAEGLAEAVESLLPQVRIDGVGMRYAKARAALKSYREAVLELSQTVTPETE